MEKEKNSNFHPTNLGHTCTIATEKLKGQRGFVDSLHHHVHHTEMYHDM